jgi:phosphoenolpyruvate-protein phosphotransferase (PTS system enzyme I)
MRLSGIAASPGLAVGPIFRFEREEFAIREIELMPEAVEGELERFHAALEISRRDLAGIRDGIAAELGEADARIYDAHLLILDDPELLASVDRGIRDQHRNAAFVFRNYMSGIASKFDNVEDEYLRERRADIADCARRVLRHLLGTGTRQFDELREPAIVVAHDLGPSEVAVLPRDKVIGFVLEVGGRTSHGAIVARGRGIPAIVSAPGALQTVRTGAIAAIDGYLGVLEMDPDENALAYYRVRLERARVRTESMRSLENEPAVTRDGHRIELGANLELPGEAAAAAASGADGVGLFRTEFFYLNRTERPTEEEQYQAYRHVTETMKGRPVIFRTMDLGGDKVASYLGVTHETNPFLGLRGIRLALTSPEMFRTQIRAIYRASAHGRVRLMFPMVSGVEELNRALLLRDEALVELQAAGQAYDPKVEVGIMIETPSAVWMADALARHSDFFSIGSNDLIQYTLAMDRDNPRLAHLYEPLDPSVLRSVRHTVEAAHAAGRWVGVCGEMAGDPQNAVLLLGLGVDELSVGVYDVPRVKAAIRSVNHAALSGLATEALRCETADAVRALMRREVDRLLPSFLVQDRAQESAPQGEA